MIWKVSKLRLGLNLTLSKDNIVSDIDVSKLVLDNESEGLIINIPGAKSAVLQWRFNGGFNYTPDPDKDHVAHVAEHMILGDHGTQRGNEFRRRLALSDSNISGRTDTDEVRYTTICPSYDWSQLLNLMQEIIYKPRITESDLAEAIKHVDSELEKRCVNPYDVLHQRLMLSMGFPVKTDDDYREQLFKIGLPDIGRYCANVYTMCNARFIMTGDFTGQTDELASMLNSSYVSRGTRLGRANPLATGNHSLHIKDDSSSSYYRLMIAMPRLLSWNDKLVMAVLTRIINFSGESCVSAKALDGGLIRSMAIKVERCTGWTLWSILGEAYPDKMGDFVALLVSELEKIATGNLDAQVLADVKSRLAAYEWTRSDSPTSVAKCLSWEYMATGRIYDISQEHQFILDIDKQAVVNMARELLASKAWSFGVIGPNSDDEVGDMSQLIAELF